MFKNKIASFLKTAVAIPMDIQYKVHLIQFIEFKVHHCYNRSHVIIYVLTFSLLVIPFTTYQQLANYSH